MTTAAGFQLDLVALKEPAEPANSSVVDAKVLLEESPRLFEGGDLALFHSLLQSSARLWGYALLLLGEAGFSLEQGLETTFFVGFPPAPDLAWVVPKCLGNPQSWLG